MRDTQPTLKVLETCKVSPRKELAMPAEVPKSVASTSVTKRAGLPTPMAKTKSTEGY